MLLGSEPCFRAERLEVESLLIFSHEANGDFTEALRLYKQLLPQLSLGDGFYLAMLNLRYAGCLLMAHR